jgi:hypothetical protein
MSSGLGSGRAYAARQLLARLSNRFVSLRDLRCDWTVTGVSPDPVATPELPSMSLDPVAASLRASHYIPPQPSIATISPALYHAGYDVVLTRGRRVISESTIQGVDMGPLPVRALFRSVTASLAGTSAVLRSRWNNHYHTLVDNLPRLDSLHQVPALSEQPIRVVFGGDLTEVERHLIPLMLPPNAHVESLPAEGLCLADEIVMPGFLSRRFAGYLPAAYREWFLDRVGPSRASRRNRRILITRARRDPRFGRAFDNEDELLAALEPLGFRGYSLDGLPVAELVSLFHDAEVIVGAHGAGLANALFARTATVIELFSTPFVTPHYYFLCKGCGHRYRWLCGTAEDRNANLRVDMPALLRALAELGI